MHFINLLYHWTNTISDSLPVTIYMAELVHRDFLEAIEQSEKTFTMMSYIWRKRNGLMIG
jgi:hypothetical protein